MFYCTFVRIRMSFWSMILASQYKLNSEYEILWFPKNGSYIYTTTTAKQSPALRVEIVYLYIIP